MKYGFEAAAYSIEIRQAVFMAGRGNTNAYLMGQRGEVWNIGCLIASKIYAIVETCLHCTGKLIGDVDGNVFGDQGLAGNDEPGCPFIVSQLN